MERIKPIQNTSGIYKIQSKINGKVYVGSAIDLKRRRHEHFNQLRKKRHYNSYLQNHVNKYKADDLIFFVIELCSKEELIKREQYWIDTLNPEFNCCKIAGSSLGVKHSEEYSKRISELKKGNKNNSGTRWSLEMKKKASERFTGKNNPNFGLKRSEETIQKMRKKHKPMPERAKQKLRKPKSISHRENLRIAQLGRKATQETKDKMSKTRLQMNFHHSEQTKKNISLTKKERNFKHSNESLQIMKEKRVLYWKNKKSLIKI